MKVQCNECGNVFKVREKAKSVHLDSVGLATAYFVECPKCKKRYLSYVHTAETRERAEDIQRASENLKRLRGSGNKKLFIEEFSMVEKQREDLKAVMSRLKEMCVSKI